MTRRPKATPAEMEARVEEAQALFGSGLRPAEVAARLGVSRRAVYHLLYTRPHVRPRKRASFAAARRGSETPIGRLDAVIESQPEAFQKWLLGSIPEGASLAEFVVSCAVDAFHESA